MTQLRSAFLSTATSHSCFFVTENANLGLDWILLMYENFKLSSSLQLIIADCETMLMNQQSLCRLNANGWINKTQVKSPTETKLRS